MRTLNEETYLADALEAIQAQVCTHDCEVIIVDSGSTDRTLEIATRFDCRIVHIRKEDFTFGRSLNVGCEAARGEFLVFLSGHCVPENEHWLQRLVEPLEAGVCHYTYGRQVGWGPTKFSETRVFLKYFPREELLPQQGFFANNANAAILRPLWKEYQFDESLTGLEDMHLAKKLVSDGYRIGYAAHSVVRHIHDESWVQVKNRYEREAIALLDIMPEASLSFFDFLRITLRSIAKDALAAMRAGVLTRNIKAIVQFRTNQFWGSYKGTRIARSIAASRRKSYFYPDRHFEKPLEREYESNRAASHESAQQQGP